MAAGEPQLTFTRHLPLTRCAVRFAQERHAGQRRPADGAAFVMHPLEVASMLDRSGGRRPARGFGFPATRTASATDVVSTSAA